MASETRSRLLRVKWSADAAGRGAATLGVVALAVAAAIGAGVALPRPEYTAAAVIGVDGGPASLRPALIQAAADTARSRQVAARAAAGLPAKVAMAPEALAAVLRVDAGLVPGTLVLRAGDADAERAASFASALAVALVAELDDRAAAVRRDGDATDALRLSRLQEIAGEAHRKVAALGGDAVDPAQARTNATARAEALRARLDAIRAILAAGNPPLGAGRDLPPTIEALQTGYLDLTRQLAKARETLGERHTTVVGLQESIRRSAAELTAAWGRLAKATEQDLSEARTAASVKAGLEPRRAAALDAARATARLADDAVTRAAAPRDADDETRWHLVSRGSVPALADGLRLPLRLALAAAAGLLVLLFGLWSTRRPREVVALERVEPDASSAEPRFFDDNALLYEACVEEAILVEDSGDTSRSADAPALRPGLEPAFAELPPEPIHTPVPPHDERGLDETSEEVSDTHPSPAERDLAATLARVLPAIDVVAAPRAGVPFVLLVTDEAGVDTTATALALGAAAADDGRRVLIVEAHARPTLAAAAASDAEPALIDVLGETRIVLRAETGAGQLYVAPAFAARLAADLARAGTAVVADDVAEEFDLVVVDGGGAGEAAALAGKVDAILRVARIGPSRVGSLMTALGSDATFLGTIATAVPMFTAPVASRAAAPAGRARAALGPHPLRRPAQVDARRRVAVR